LLLKWAQSLGPIPNPTRILLKLSRNCELWLDWEFTTLACFLSLYLLDLSDSIVGFGLSLKVSLYLSLILLVIAYVLYRPIRPKPNMKYTSRHATILVPTIDSGEEIKAAIKSWLKSDPYEIIFITTPIAEEALWNLARTVDPEGKKVRVITVKHPNKRNQMTAGVNQVKTPITIFADDDVIWPSNMVNWLCAPFSDDQMGGVGSSQRVLPVSKRFTIWEIIAAFRLSLRNIEITASTYIDGGVTCLSGRTAAYRTSILRDPDFQWEFTNEYWVSKYHLHSGDDKFLTRWMHSHRWKTFIQTHREATLLSTFKDNWRFLKQLLRWTRNSWRSDFKSLFVERRIWRSHPFTAFTMFDKIFNPLTLYFGPIAFAYLATKDDRTTWYFLFLMFLGYIFVTRALKYMPHLLWRPQDIFALPAMILFQYYFGLMKIYCLFTLNVTNWGTRTGADHKEASDITEIYRVHHEVYDDTEIPEEEKQRPNTYEFSEDLEGRRNEISRSWRSFKRPSHIVAEQMAEREVIPPVAARRDPRTVHRSTSIQQFHQEAGRTDGARDSMATMAGPSASAVGTAVNERPRTVVGSVLSETETSLSESIIQSLRASQVGGQGGIRENRNSASNSSIASWRHSAGSFVVPTGAGGGGDASDGESEVTRYSVDSSAMGVDSTAFRIGAGRQEEGSDSDGSESSGRQL
jgi:hypothetical protein